jgi:DDE superfamily endonuclease
LEDEAGQSLRPPKARTWARRGRTPVATVSGKGSGRVSVAGLACYKPGSRSRFFYRTRIHTGRKGERRSLSEADYAGLVTAAHQQLHAPVILCWDNLNTHVSGVMRTMLQTHRDWLTVIQMPAYAPDLNPAEGCLVQHEEQPGQPGLLQHTPPAGRHREEPAQAHPVPARSHRRLPRPDRPQPRTPTTVEPDPGLSIPVAGYKHDLAHSI